MGPVVKFDSFFGWRTMPRIRMTHERRYYPMVERFLSDGLGCFVAKQTKGVRGVGIADLLGARDIGGELDAQVELIAVEVKLTRDNFGKSLGQALGYTLFANKSYLAVPFRRAETFDDEERDEAAHLGVGLIRVGGWQKKRTEEVLTPRSGEPIEALRLKAIANLGYYKCAVCATMIGPEEELGWTKRVETALSEQKALYFNRQIRDGRKVRRLLFMNRREQDVARETYVCSECVRRVIPRAKSA